jgi:hypothetical protein
MSDVVIYHPGIAQQAAVPEESLPHYRQSGWLLLSEHQGNEAASAEPVAPDGTAASKISKKDGDR